MRTAANLIIEGRMRPTAAACAPLV